MKVMGLDPGSKRVGVAVSDDLGMTASGIATIVWKNKKTLLAEIEKLAKEHKVDTIVIGLPKRMDGTHGPEAEWALILAEEVETRLKIPVKTWDERFSTSAVERILIDADMSRKKRKKVRDKMAAAYILQGYLDFLSVQNEIEK